MEILLSAYQYDSKPSPQDFAPFFKLLSRIDCKHPLIYTEIMNKYNYLFDNIKKDEFHLSYLVNIGQQGKIDFKVEPIFNKIKNKSRGLPIKDKNKIFCTLVMSDYMNLNELGYFTALYSIPVTKSLNSIDLYTCLLCFYKLASSKNGKKSFGKEVTEINKRSNP
jgi:hypothetical protein